MDNLNWESCKPNREEIEWLTMKKEFGVQLARVFDLPPSLIGTVDIIVEGSATVIDNETKLLPVASEAKQ
jgi:hypothetical protein